MLSSKDIFLTKATGGTTQYQISRSLAFGGSTLGYMFLTNGTPSNAGIYTYAFWYKPVFPTRDATYSLKASLMAGGTGASTSSTIDEIVHEANGTFSLRLKGGYVITTQYVFWGPGWYHLVFAVDVTQATGALGARIFVNGVQQTVTTSGTYVQNATLAMNTNAVNRYVGATSSGGTYGSLLADLHFLDGVVPTTTTRTINQVTNTVLTMFGSFSSTTGQWTPISYTGSYGNNGGRYTFADTSSVSNLGIDYSGRGNNFGSLNFTLANNYTSNSSYDSPTPYIGSDGFTRGIFDEFNRLKTNIQFSNGNSVSKNPTSGLKSYWAGFDLSNGNYYWEMYSGTITNNGFTVYLGDQMGTNTTASVIVNFVSPTEKKYGFRFTSSTRLWEYTPDGTTWNTIATIPAATTTTWQGIYVYILCDLGKFIYYNAGQQPFTWTIPSGYKTVCATNVTDPPIICATDVVRTSVYTGTGATQSISNISNAFTSTNLQPDFVWIYPNSASLNSVTYSSLLGATNSLDLSATTAKTVKTTGLTSFNTDGFTLGADAQANTSATQYLATQFAINQTTVTNTTGTVTASVRANPSAGLSLLTFTAPSTAGAFTVGHGLNAAPKFIMLRSTGATGSNWFCYSSIYGNTQYWPFNGTLAPVTSGIWNNTDPTSSVVNLNTSGLTLSNTYEMFCLTPINGFSVVKQVSGDVNSNNFTFGFSPQILIIREVNTGATTNVVYNPTLSTNQYNSYVAVFQKTYPGLASAWSTYSATHAFAWLSNGVYGGGGSFFLTTNYQIIAIGTPEKYATGR